jgi:RNA-directed DNA polymerase
MHEHGKSDSSIVPKKLSNKSVSMLAERVEVSGLAKSNSLQQNRCRTQCRESLQSALERIRQAAIRDRRQKFTSLWHHVYDVERLREEYYNLKRKSAVGVDGQSWQEYGENLEDNIRRLSSQLQHGSYRAKPVKRVFIPKSDGRERPIGIPAIEDKIIQRSAASVLQTIYEVDFKGYSYGFRPGRGAHDALDALAVGITERKVDWVLDADIRGYFDTIDHEWLVKFIEHRVADRRVIRHIKKWLNAGVLEEGKRVRVDEGTPQGGSISPVLANIYLHYVFDLWAANWRKHRAHGDVIMVRYADDMLVGFQYKSDAERFRLELEQRFQKFNLELNAEKTRLIEFGRFAAERRRSRGEGKPETFDFLGFTHICSKMRTGRFVVLRRPMKKRIRAKLKEIKRILRMYLHAPIAQVGQWLRAVLNGWYRYYGVPLTFEVMGTFRRQVAWLWFRTLRRRSQKSRMTWRRMHLLINCWLPRPRIMHPYPWDRLRVKTQGRSPVQ